MSYGEDENKFTIKCSLNFVDLCTYVYDRKM